MCCRVNCATIHWQILSLQKHSQLAPATKMVTLKCKHSMCLKAGISGTVGRAKLAWATQVLRLNTPNISITDLVVSFFLFLSYQINLWQPRCPYASLFFSHYAACTPHSFHLRAVHGYVFLSSLPFCHRRAVASCITSFPFHGRAWCTLLPHATRVWNILEQSLVDPIQTCTYSNSSI